MKVIYIICVITLFSCSAKYHYSKALKKGLQVIKTSDTIRITTIDSVPVIKHDTIIYEHFYTSKDTVIMYENIFVPQTRLETRIEYKLQRDTLRMITRVETQRAKADGKANSKPNYWIILIYLSIVGLLAFLGSRLINKYL